jgi:hypothetical protein
MPETRTLQSHNRVVAAAAGTMAGVILGGVVVILEFDKDCLGSPWKSIEVGDDGRRPWFKRQVAVVEPPGPSAFCIFGASENIG